jgi:hypothetical protein
LSRVFNLNLKTALIHSVKVKMQMTDAAPILKCRNVVVSLRGLAEGDGRKAILFVPSGEVKRIVLKYGNPEHRPIVSLVIGGVMGLLGIIGFVELFLAPRGLRYELGMIFFGLIGGSLIFDATKKRYFLEVHKAKGDCRLVFSRQVSRQEVQDFCEKVRNAYKYDISESL